MPSYALRVGDKAVEMSAQKRRHMLPIPGSEDEKLAMETLAKIKARRGLPSELARELGITPQAIDQWRVVPLWAVNDVSRITDIARNLIRPDWITASGHLRTK